MIGPPNVTSLYVIVAFVASCWIFNRFLFAPLTAILDARERDEREAENAYTASLAALQSALAAGEARLSDARREALRSREELRSQGLTELERRLGEANVRAGEALARGTGEIEQQARDVAKTLPERARGLARDLAEKILGRKLAA
jgi:F-type H+-transporting ATPase subunit b